MSGPKKTYLSIAVRSYLLASFCIFILYGVWCVKVSAKAIPSTRANEAVKGWLAREARPMESDLGSEVRNIESFADSNGQPSYYVAYLKPNGFVIISADDLVEPIICFSSDGTFDPSPNNPLGALVGRDVPARINASRSIQEKSQAMGVKSELTNRQAAMHKSADNAFSKWTELSATVDGLASSKYKSGITDIRVAPLLRTKWGQTTDSCFNALYNYYTPVYGDGNWRNYPSGCVATAMAQYMRFWQYPTSGVGTASFPITINGYSNTRSLRGGDGYGGPYNWSQMPTAPGCSATVVQRQAIGSLLYDAGVSAKMDYGTDSSGAYLYDAAAALVYTFGYYNAICGSNNGYDDIGAGLAGMINPNLDSGNPVILGISSDSGHAVVADGYGFQGSTPYHHLNMGWNGIYNVWYNLPNVDSPYYVFNVVDTAIYNIFIEGTGEIISGRIMAPGSKSPVSGAIVTAINGGSDETFQTTTNAKGIYALTKVSPYSSYAISVTKPGYSFPDSVAAETGSSQDGQATSGNCWGVDFVSDAIISKCAVTAGKTYDTGTITISGTLNAYTEDILSAGEIDISINSENMPAPFAQAFPVNATTFKSNKFKCSITNTPSTTSFAYDPTSTKFSFSAKNVDLTGLSCPLDMQVIIAGFNEITEVNELIVNTKKPLPINFLMNVTNSLRVDKAKFTRDKYSSNITSVTASGCFSVQNITDSNMAANPFDITIGSKTFTIPAGNFKYSKGKFSCSKVLLAGNEITAAAFDFNKCIWTLTIKGMTIPDAPGETNFDMLCGAFSAGTTVILP